MPAVRTRPGVQPSIRLRPVPALDPPFDDESAIATWPPSSVDQLALDLWRGARCRPGRPARARGADAHGGGPGTDVHATAAGPAGAPAAAGPVSHPPVGPRPTVPACRPPRWRSRPPRRSRPPTGSSALPGDPQRLPADRAAPAAVRPGRRAPRCCRAGPRRAPLSVHRAGDAPAPPGPPDLRAPAAGLRAPPRRRRGRRRAQRRERGPGRGLAPGTPPGQLALHHAPASSEIAGQVAEPGGPPGVPLPGALDQEVPVGVPGLQDVSAGAR